MVAGNPLRPRVELRFAVHEETIMVVPVIQLHLEQPRAVRLALHGMGGLIPIIEIAGYMNLFGFRGQADEIDRLSHFLGGIPISSEEGT